MFGCIASIVTLQRASRLGDDEVGNDIVTYLGVSSSNSGMLP